MRVIIMSGIPGSGKDTWIRESFDSSYGSNETFSHKPIAYVVSADNFFMKGEKYDFNPRLLPDAHASCMREFVDLLIADSLSDPDTAGPAALIVNNTNTTPIEIAPYYAVAKAFGKRVQIVTLLAPPDVCAARNIHGVPLAACIAADKRIRERVIPSFWELDNA